jgi:hypothetical protein
MSSNNITAIMARLNKINANIANLKGETRKKMNLKIKSIDEEIKNLKGLVNLYNTLAKREQYNVHEMEKYEKLMRDAQRQLLIKEKERKELLANQAGGKRNKKSRRKTRRN